MSEERSQYRVVQNGNPFEDARTVALAHGREVLSVVDGGANVGDVTRHLLDNFPLCRVHAFEPDLSSARTLSDRYATDDRVVVQTVGLSDRSEQRRLHRFEESGLNSLLPLSAGSAAFLEGYSTQPAESSQVGLVTLDEYCGEQSLSSVDFLKLDLQGWEIACLEGATGLFERHRVHAVYVEVNFVELYAGQIYYEDVALWLRQRGFALHNLYALSYNRAGRLCWADALFLPTVDA